MFVSPVRKGFSVIPRVFSPRPYGVAEVADEKVKVSLNDTTPGYLNGKAVAGNSITLTEVDDAADETLSIDTIQDIRATASPTFNDLTISTPVNIYALSHDSFADSHDLTTDIDHDTITNNHDLTTDIDHDLITNFTAAEHFTMLDEDDLTSDSDTQAATQQSIKAYVDALSFADHSARHEWGGADVLSLKSLMANQVKLTFDWQTHDGWTEANVNSGTVSWNILATILQTGDGDPDPEPKNVASAYTGTISRGYWTHPGRSAYDFWIVDSRTTLANSTAWLGFFGATTPTNTVKHVGWKIIGGVIWASNADGTTQTITSTGVSIATQYTRKELFIDAGSASLKFYVDGVLKATHTTNLPGGGAIRNIMYIERDGSVNEGIQVYLINVVM